VLEHHIATGLHRRIGAAPSNFADHLEPVDADQAQEIVKDPYVFDFLDLTERSRERAIETALTERLQETLAELGPGFAFVGRQVHFAVDGDEFLVDLLLFHAEQIRYVVVELKVGKFRHEFAGQLAFYLSSMTSSATPTGTLRLSGSCCAAVDPRRASFGTRCAPPTPRWPSPPTPTTPFRPLSRQRFHPSRRSPRRFPVPAS